MSLLATWTQGYRGRSEIPLVSKRWHTHSNFSFLLIPSNTFGKGTALGPRRGPSLQKTPVRPSSLPTSASATRTWELPWIPCSLSPCTASPLARPSTLNLTTSHHLTSVLACPSHGAPAMITPLPLLPLQPQVHTAGVAEVWRGEVTGSTWHSWSTVGGPSNTMQPLSRLQEMEGRRATSV